MKLPIPDAVRKEMQMRMKNQLDISALIANYSIAGEDLSGAILTNFDRAGEDLTKLNLSNAIIGTVGKETKLSRCNFTGSCFKGTRFLGKIIAKKSIFKNCDFTNAYIPYCDYRLSDFRGCTFCGTVFTVHTHYSVGSRFDNAFFKDMAEQWGIVILTKEEYAKLKEYETMYLKDKTQCLQ